MDIKSIQDIAIKEIIVLLVSGLVTAAGVVYLAIRDPLKEMILQNVPPIILLIVPTILLCLLILSTTYAISFYKRLIDPYLKDYNFDEKSGVSINIKNGMFYCTNCLSKKIYIPLRKSSSHWHCTNKECPSYPDPEYIPKPIPPDEQPRRRVISEGIRQRW